ncbi:MAG: LCP family protein [Firmicutes bacterium]|nr:LCP family protein [Bacillota bacterium]
MKRLWLVVGSYQYDRNRRKSNKKKSYLLQKTLISLVLVTAILFNAVYVVYNSFISRINFVDPPSNSDISFTDFDVSYTDLEDDSDNIPDDVIVSTEDVTMYLLVGSDSRIGTDAQSRSDSLIIAAVDRKHKKIKLISLMRDMLVKIPGKGYNRINAAYSFDSGRKDMTLSYTRKTIKANFGIDVEKLVVIDFTGFKKIIDMMGGVEMTLNAAEAKYMCSHKVYGKFPRFSKGAGKYTLSGAEALNYARMRKVGNSDFERTERQRKMISAMINKMKDQSYIKMASMIHEALGYVITNVSQGEILGLAFDAPNLLNYDIVQYRIPVDGTFNFKSVIIGGTKCSILWANYKWNATHLKSFIYDDDMTYANSKKKAKATIPYLPNSVEEANKTTTTTQASGSDTQNTEAQAQSLDNAA